LLAALAPEESWPANAHAVAAQLCRRADAGDHGADVTDRPQPVTKRLVCTAVAANIRSPRCRHEGFIVRRILASLFVIVAVVGIGIFATGAYFTDTVSTTNQVFVTGSADLKLGACGEISQNCATTAADMDSWDMGPLPDELIGPDIVNSGCLVVENKGDYLLNLTGSAVVTSQSHPDMDYFFQVRLDQANSGCDVTSNLLDWTRAENVSSMSLGSLAPGARMYLVLSNRWDSTGDQNYLQDGWLVLKTLLEGKTN
jgi:hypothetical protein